MASFRLSRSIAAQPASLRSQNGSRNPSLRSVIWTCSYAVGHEHAAEVGHRETEHHVAAGGLLRVVADVLQRPLVDVEPAGDIAVEEERLGEGELVVLRAVARLQRQRQALAAAEEVGRLERELAEEALVLRHARAERQLVAVLLLEGERHVDRVVAAGRLVHLHRPLVLLVDLLEVAELIQPADAVFQRLGVEHAAFDQPHLAADDVVARRRVAREDDPVDEELLPLGETHRHVHRRILVRAVGAAVGLDRGQELRHLRFLRRRLVTRLQVREAGEVHVPAAAVDLLRLAQAVDDILPRCTSRPASP